MKEQTKFNLIMTITILVLTILITWLVGIPILESHDICNSMNLSGCGK